MRKQKLFEKGYYPAQFKGVVRYKCKRTKRHMARFRFLVYNDDLEEYETYCTNDAWHADEVDEFLLEHYEATEHGLQNRWFEVSLGLTSWGQNTILSQIRTPGGIVPKWARDTQDSWQSENNGLAKEKYLNDRRKKDPNFKNAEKIRYATWKAYKGITNGFKALGCNTEELRLHLASQFEEGMSHDNYGTVWEIDHAKPLSRFDLTNKEDVLEAAHYTNLQPMLCEENKAKYNTVG